MRCGRLRLELRNDQLANRRRGRGRGADRRGRTARHDRPRRHCDADRGRDLVRLLSPGLRAASHPMSETPPAGHGAAGHEAEATAARVERRWASMAIAIVLVLAAMAGFAGIHQATMPQTQVETADPKILHLGGEFVETNLGSATEPDGSVTVRVVGQQYSFTPSCILVPAETPITLRGTSPDVVHGLLIEGTTINTMLVPGYVSELPMRFAA